MTKRKIFICKASGATTGSTAGAGSNAGTGAGANAANNAAASSGGVDGSAVASSILGSIFGGPQVGDISYEGPYAFKTLWQEITKGINSITNGISSAAISRNNNAAMTAQWYWLHARDGQDSRDNNLGFYITLGLTLIIGLLFFIIKDKK